MKEAVKTGLLGSVMGGFIGLLVYQNHPVKKPGRPINPENNRR
jgi:hypothetical protein